MQLSPGTVIAGRYRLERKVGTGGMGEVWLGEHTGVGVRVAVKTLLAEPGEDPEVVTRFKREAYVLARVRSDYVARILDFVTDEEHGAALVMEFVDGEPLSKALHVKRLTVEQTIELGADIASALVDLHTAQVVHRDLKPGNIILKPLPDGRKRAVVVDFGVSRMLTSGDSEEEITGITRTGMALGTLEYMAPEQILSSRDAKATADVYALGAILWRAVVGMHVFGDVYDVELAQQKIRVEAPPLVLERNDAVARGLTACIARMLKRRPSERHATADELLRDFLTLREAARALSIDLDGATTQSSGRSLFLNEATTPDGPAAKSSRAQPTSTSSTSMPIGKELGRGRGIPTAFFVVGLASALGTGAAIGIQWQKQHPPAARECPTAAPIASSANAAGQDAADAASAKATPVAAFDDAGAAGDAGSGDAAATDLDGLDPASRAALEGTLPSMDPDAVTGRDAGATLAPRLPGRAIPTPVSVPKPNTAPVGTIVF